MPKVHLSLFVTTDVHGRIVPEPEQTRVGSLSLLASALADLRQHVPNVIALDNGDTLQGSAVSDWAAAVQPALVNPVIQTFNVMGYDAGTLGNHEFDFGTAFLGAAIKDAQFPFVCANIVSTDPHLSKVQPFVLIERKMTDTQGAPRIVKIGVTGCITQATQHWARKDLGTHTQITDCVAATRHALAALDQMGADVTICLAHMGMAEKGATADTAMNENRADELAELSNLDVLITGHTHMSFATRNATKPVIVSPGSKAQAYGRVDLELDGTGATVSDARIIPCPPAPQDTAITDLAAPYLQGVSAWQSQRLGSTDVPLSTDFALLFPSTALQLIADAKLAWANTQNIPRDQPVLAQAAALRFGLMRRRESYTHIPKGPITRADLLHLYPFQNDIALVTITGAQLHQLLLNSAQCFAQCSPAQDGPQWIMQSGVAPYRSDVIFGIDYRVDITKATDDPARITPILHNGTAITADMRFTLATSEFAMNDRMPAIGGPLDILRIGAAPSLRDVLTDHLEQASPVTPRPTHAGCPIGAPGQTIAFYAPDRAPPEIDGLQRIAPHPTEPDMARFDYTFPRDAPPVS
ncbi:bifunctional UDP-sugar hydrolase/5'-nucleotidase [Nereida sp. MMG025]|uniref:bifunctional metallophosphatase/5'-nucleotidase n=1 Tax=Nereida sp. MMG025 TaxID=2909981 RepID=UPI001EFF79AA|nr:5'-nucleotidase C-terminal domain-containing protein [Nereida sp. MMG025]MCF6444301.1 5'-nucleotidase C-terminal domain-containing protein [Nereida sp. MMG025]